MKASERAGPSGEGAKSKNTHHDSLAESSQHCGSDDMHAYALHRHNLVKYLSRSTKYVTYEKIKTK